MRILFMGTPDFAVPALQALLQSPHEVVAVYSQPPRPAGRGLKLTPSPVQKLAEQHAIPVFTPSSLKTAEAQAEFSQHQADIAVVAAYGLLLPQAILDAPRFGCINIHPSDLPRWRGAAPIQRTLMAGDTETACCVMQLELGLDTGPILRRDAYTIPPEMDAGELHRIMAEIGAQQVLAVLEQFASDTPPLATPQASEGVTHAEKISKAERPLDWSRPAIALQHHIRGLSPAPAATAEIAGETVKILRATVEAGAPQKAAGEALDDNLLINAGNGSALRLLELQRPGKNRQTAAQFLQGIPVAKGSQVKNSIRG